MNSTEMRKAVLENLSVTEQDAQAKATSYSEREKAIEKNISDLKAECEAKTKKLNAEIEKLQNELNGIEKPYTVKQEKLERGKELVEEQRQLWSKTAKFKRLLSALTSPSLDAKAFGKAMFAFINWHDPDSNNEASRRVGYMQTCNFHEKRKEGQVKGCLIIGWKKDNWQGADKRYIAIKNGKVISAMHLTPAQHVGDTASSTWFGVKVAKERKYWTGATMFEWVAQEWSKGLTDEELVQFFMD